MYIRGHHISADDRRGEGSEPKYHHGVRGGLSVGWQTRNMMVKAWYACFRPVIPLFRWANLASADIWMTPNLSDTLWGWCIVLHPSPHSSPWEWQEMLQYINVIMMWTISTLVCSFNTTLCLFHNLIEHYGIQTHICDWE